MGMFDSIKCEYPLPLPEGVEKLGFIQKDIEFQTKDFENLLDYYTIRENGELYKTNSKYKWVDDDNHFLKGYMDVVSSEEAKEPYHGMLNFYSYDDFDQEDGKVINVNIDYIAKFTDGLLVDVKIDKHEIRDVTEYKEKTRKIIQDSIKENKKWYNAYFLRTKFYYKVRKVIFSIMNCWLKWNNSINYFLIRHL